LRLFFAELSKKGNAISNVLPDVISALSESDRPLEPEKFKSVAAYLFSFIEKVCLASSDGLCTPS
jgi:condensin complex subunit 1